MAHSFTPSLSRRYLRHGTLLQLAAFEGVMRLGSVTRAAEAQCMAQSTLSGHLRKLSEALGVRLFEIQGKRLVPTDAALALLQGASEVFAAFERCELVLAAMRPGSIYPSNGAVRASANSLRALSPAWVAQQAPRHSEL